MPNEVIAKEKRWLDDRIYDLTGAFEQLPQWEIISRTRYFYRAERVV